MFVLGRDESGKGGRAGGEIKALGVFGAGEADEAGGGVAERDGDRGWSGNVVTEAAIDEGDVVGVCGDEGSREDVDFSVLNELELVRLGEEGEAKVGVCLEGDKGLNGGLVVRVDRGLGDLVNFRAGGVNEVGEGRGAGHVGVGWFENVFSEFEIDFYDFVGRGGGLVLGDLARVNFI